MRTSGLIILLLAILGGGAWMMFPGRAGSSEDGSPTRSSLETDRPSDPRARTDDPEHSTVAEPRRARRDDGSLAVIPPLVTPPTPAPDLGLADLPPLPPEPPPPPPPRQRTLPTAP